MSNDPSGVAMTTMKARHLAADRCRSNLKPHCEVSTQLAANKELLYTIKGLPAVDDDEFEEEGNVH